MKITFINPNISGIISLNLGLAYVISSAERFHQVRLLDLNFHQNDYLSYVQNALAQDRPDVIGFSVTTFNFKSSLEIAQTIRQAYPGIPFLFGGVHPTLLPEETIRHPLVDALCIGEGETAILEYLQKLENGEPPDVPGIWYKDASGTIHRNPLRPFHQDIDVLPFPNLDHWDIDRFLTSNVYCLPGNLYILSSRGCPYTCSFCSNEAIRKAVPGNYYRARSPENLLREIALNKTKYQKKGFTTIYFADETFGLDLKQLEHFCELYRKEGFSRELKWVCETRADLVTPEWARTVARAGCVMVNLGIESGDDHIRTAVYKKDISQEAIRQAVRNLNACGIVYGFYFMIGCPQDTTASINASLQLVRDLNPIMTHIAFYEPLPKTALYEEVCRGGGLAVPAGSALRLPRVATPHVRLRDFRRIARAVHDSIIGKVMPADALHTAAENLRIMVRR
jgi:radical SAM superfamily enzyme YgiQ (UPF0313 family)